MIIRKLHESWKMRIAGTEEFIPAEVPGSVYNDLLAAGRMEDPYYRDNEEKALKVMDDDFEYVSVFDVERNILDCEAVMLRFDGIDTVADICLNGKWIAYVENMHRTWEFPVKEILREKGNELKVVLHSPTKFIQKEYEKEPIPGSGDAMRGFPYLRKAHCMFGWDWGPRLPDAGIWRDVKLVGFDEARIDSVYITQTHEENKVTLKLDVDVERLGEERLRRFGRDDGRLSGLCCRVKVTAPQGEEKVYSHEEMMAGIRLENPRLWWPNGYGEQPLYGVEVELLADATEAVDSGSGKQEVLESRAASEAGSKAAACRHETILDAWSRRIGLRTMEVCTDKDEYGEQFCHMVNGVKIFAMGADYIPEDNILPRVTPERTYNLLLQAKNANHNCVRVWGGGHYPGDAFWDACDELGLVVWEDFMFACATYNLTAEFEENIRAEFADNIKRIRHHASLGLWCGNNEMESFIAPGGYYWISKPVQKSDYVKMYEYILPQMVREYDPNTFYWPSSPSSGGAFDDPNDENRGDVHYWQVWHGNRPFTAYRKHYFRYVSEFGFQSFPSLKTCETFTLPGDRNIFSHVMEKHQRNASANGKIMNYMQQTFLYPSDFGTLLYASQLLQAEAIRYGVEHFRRNRGRCMGTVVWQLNDCWPVASWSSIDYYGRWKALHYYEKRFFAPVMLSCEEEGLLTQDANVNAQPYEVKKSVRLNVANETREDIQVTVRWALRDAGARVKREGEQEVAVPALSSFWLEREDMGDASLYGDYVSYECLRDGTAISGGTALFCAPKYFEFEDPLLSVRADGDELVVTARAYAKSVEIINEADDLLLEDNYFDMNAGERRVKVLKGAPEGLKIRSVYDIA